MDEDEPTRRLFWREVVPGAIVLLVIFVVAYLLGRPGGPLYGLL